MVPVVIVPPLPLVVWGRADSLAADDASVPLIPCCADSIAADAAFDAAAESRAADDAAAADVDGRCRVADPVGG